MLYPPFFYSNLGYFACRRRVKDKKLLKNLAHFRHFRENTAKICSLICPAGHYFIRFHFSYMAELSATVKKYILYGYECVDDEIPGFFVLHWHPPPPLKHRCNLMRRIQNRHTPVAAPTGYSLPPTPPPQPEPVKLPSPTSHQGVCYGFSSLSLVDFPLSQAAFGMISGSKAAFEKSFIITGGYLKAREQGVIKRCRLSSLTNRDPRIRFQMRGLRGLSQWVQLCTSRSRDMEPK